MKKLMMIFSLILSNAVYAQSSKSVEVPDDTILREDQRHQKRSAGVELTL